MAKIRMLVRTAWTPLLLAGNRKITKDTTTSIFEDMASQPFSSVLHIMFRVIDEDYLSHK